MFLSDGDAPVADAVLEQLRQSEVRLRSFGVGSGATCERSLSLYKLAAATGESCEVVRNPASLAVALTGSQPEAVNGVTVTINDVSVAADLDALGGWSADFTLGAGTYTATARGILASGATVSTQRTFTVAPSASGPPPGSVSVGPGSKATAIKMNKPGPTRKPLPATVTGRVGRFTSEFETTKELEGARLVLEAQRGVGAPWQAVDRDKADRSGALRPQVAGQEVDDHAARRTPAASRLRRQYRCGACSGDLPLQSCEARQRLDLEVQHDSQGRQQGAPAPERKGDQFRPRGGRDLQAAWDRVGRRVHRRRHRR